MIAGVEKRAGFGIADWLISYKAEWARPDLIAGLTAAAVVVPKAMAYAGIAGLPVQTGLYTTFVPMIVYALLGSSRVLSVSTTTTIAILTASTLGAAVPGHDPPSLPAAAVTLTVLVGGMLLTAWVLRLGFIANFISEPVLIGFKAAIGLVIVVDQIPKILGIHVPHGSFFNNIVSILRGLPETSLPTLAVGISMIGMLVLFERIAPTFPAPLIAVASGIVATSLFSLQTHGVELVGHIPGGLPSLAMPNMSFVAQMWPGALGIALMSFTETVAAGRAFVGSGEPIPHANRELLATGLANVVGGIFGAMPGGGGTTQTAVNRLAGAKTQLSEIVTALISLITMLFLAPLIGMIPQPTLAAIVIVYSIGLIKPQEFRAILSIRRTEFIWALTAFASVVVLGTLKGIIVAIVVSLIALAYQVADPPVYVLGRKPGTNVFRPRSEEHPEDEIFPGLLLLRLEGRVFFANAEHIGQKINPLIAEYRPKVVVIDLSGVPDLEYTALKMLTEAEKKHHEAGVLLWLVRANPQVLEVIRRSSLGQALGREALLFNVETAVAKFQQAGTLSTG